MQDLEQSIRERAYQLWMESGCIDGNDQAHWLAAQREILQASLGEVARVTASAAPGNPKRARVPRKKMKAA